ADATAFAGIVLDHPRVAVSYAAVLRCREKQPRAHIFLIALLHLHAIALVEPGCEHRAIRIEGERLEALAFGVRRDRRGLGETLAAVAGMRDQHLSVEGLVPEDREGERNTPIPIEHHRGPRIGPPIEIELLLRDLNGGGETLAAIA